MTILSAPEKYDPKIGDPVTVEWIDATKCEGAEFHDFEEMPDPITSWTTGYFVGMDDNKIAIAMTIHSEDVKIGKATTYRDVMVIPLRQMIFLGPPFRPIIAGLK